ncbi:MAG TPA: TIGR02266 family protein, partial [Polyangiaceae bacterium]
MTQDTRKDRRVKIVSLNVRYKSATVDEFIENHAHDVSRGGIYIKTGSPFPPGTLLKFEIRLASDQAVIMGVGRVVWKRDNVQGTGDRPAGMGVKFIKIDDPSKGVIDKLVTSRADAGQAYESESEAPAPEAPGALAAAGAKASPQANRNVGKSTMLGIGALPGGTRAASNRSSSPSSPPRPAASAASGGGGGMFPKTNSEAEMPPKQEQTVMKQAAELLE